MLSSNAEGPTTPGQRARTGPHGRTVEWVIETRTPAELLRSGVSWPEQPRILAAPRSLVHGLEGGTLSTDELQRLNGFLISADRERFRLAHELKREILAHLLDVTPRSLSFRYTERGKPFIPGSDLAFNISHSGDWILLGVLAGHRLGVDVEHNRPDLLEPMAHWIFHAHEYREWVASDYPDTMLGWHWVMKEALAKAAGAGIALPFYSVPLYPHHNHYESWHQQSRWLLDRRALDEQHCMAVATDAPMAQVNLTVLTSPDQSTSSMASS